MNKEALNQYSVWLVVFIQSRCFCQQTFGAV